MAPDTNTIVLYTSPFHLNSISILADFIATRHPSISVLILSTDAAPPIPFTTPSITHRCLPTPPLPQNTSFHDPAQLFQISRLNYPNLLQILHETSRQSNIRALILDFFCSPAFQVSTSLNIPTYFFAPPGAFGLCNFLYWPTIHRNICTDMAELNDFVDIPGGPPVHSSEFPRDLFFRQSNVYNELLETSMNMRRSAGIIVNSFYALEVRAMEALVNGLCVPEAPAETPPVYAIGPLIADVVEGVEHECLQWLDLQPSKSVVFLCFGREGVFSGEQMKETAAGLESSGWRFLWTVRGEAGSVLPEGFLERTKGRGYVASWAPQREVLSHEAVGGFVTHCGQSSVLEAVASGVPMIGWPLYAEQRMKRVVMVEEWGVALGMEAEEDGVVRAAEVERRVRELMEVGRGRGRGREVRRRVEEMKWSAAAAVRKGGSSVVALEKFVEAVMGGN